MRRLVVAPATLLALLAPLALLPSATPAASATPTSALSAPAATRAERAERALERVSALLGPSAGRGQTAPSPDAAPSLTLALRDLARLRGSLPPAQRRVADDYAARPTDSSGAAFGVEYSTDEAPPLCTKRVCVHRVASTEDRATRDYARQVLATLSHVQTTYVDAGYRPPLPDGAARHDGGDPRPDVYLADIGDRGVYGYCTSDEPYRAGDKTTWAYCVLDNDYASTQFPQHTPRENLQVTAAHEYFHAVQFGYDVTEDAWFLESTAAWVEDEVYDAVDDNRQYLSAGPMGRPAASMDEDRRGLEVYGAWSYVRFLTERHPAAEGGLPTLVRTMWRRADASSGAPDEYSLQAVRSTLAGVGDDASTAFADYSVANRHPAAVYEEGAAYPVAGLDGSIVLRGDQRRFSDRRLVNHLTSHTFRLRPAAGLRSPAWRVRLRLDLPPTRRGSQARITVVRPDGRLDVTRVRLGADGDRHTSRAFSSRRVAAVEVTLVDASDRIRRCGSGSSISCGGLARDDRVPFALSARLVRAG